MNVLDFTTYPLAGPSGIRTDHAFTAQHLTGSGTFLTLRSRGLRVRLRDADDWFLGMMRQHEEFVVETDEAGEWPVPFFSETVQQVVVE